MSNETSPLSDSSNSSPNPMVGSYDLDDLTLYGAPAPLRLNRSATVRRANNVSKREEATSVDDFVLPLSTQGDKFRRSLDSSYRRSLDSISEYKAKISFSTVGLYSTRNATSIDSTTSDCTDYAIRSSSDCATNGEKTLTSTGSSYLSWIESVNSEYFGCSSTSADVVDVDNKVGEWNNFWLNYNSPHNRYLSSHCISNEHEDKTGDDASDCKSTCSTQRDFNEKLPIEQVTLTYDEVSEAINCSQRITEILQRAVKRNETGDRSRNDSYSQNTSSFNEEVTKERGVPIDSQDLQKQKQLLKPPSQSGNCINVLLTSGVADILKRVINKRREVVAPDDGSSTARSSVDWSTGK